MRLKLSKEHQSHDKLIGLTSVQVGLEGAAPAGASCSSCFRALGSVVGALHVKFWHTNALAAAVACIRATACQMQL